MNRWIRLSAAVVAMMMIANLQYAWTLFVKPIVGAHHWKLSDVQWGFTIFIALETWMMPLSGWLIDLLGPRTFMTVAGVMCGIGWAGMGQAATLPELYLLYALAGFGAALVYCGSIGIALKWFPDKRGLASGLISAGFGSGAALFIPIIAHLIHTSDYRTAFLYSGIGQGLVIVCAAQFLQNPAETASRCPPRRASRSAAITRDFNSLEMLQTPQFYIFFAMALMMGIGGLMVTAQVAPMADTLKIGAAALTLALTLNPIANGASRIFWGWVSDHVGRERTMFIAFVLTIDFLAEHRYHRPSIHRWVHRLPVPGLLHLGRSLFAVSVALRGLVWRTERQLQLQLYVQRQRCGVDLGRRRGGADLREDPLVELRILRVRRAGADHGVHGAGASQDAVAGQARRTR